MSGHVFRIWKCEILKNSIWRGEKKEGSQSKLSMLLSTSTFISLCFCSSKRFKCSHEKYTKNTGRTVTCLWYCNKGYDPKSYSSEIKILEVTLILGTSLDFPVVNTPCFCSRWGTQVQFLVRNWYSTCCMVWPKNRIEKKKTKKPLIFYRKASNFCCCSVA